MIAKRVIPCLDVHDGQVTRGVQFGKAEAGELRNVGDPVELALRYNEQGADEMVFFDITAMCSRLLHCCGWSTLEVVTCIHRLS